MRRLAQNNSLDVLRDSSFRNRERLFNDFFHGRGGIPGALVGTMKHDNACMVACKSCPHAGVPPAICVNRTFVSYRVTPLQTAAGHRVITMVAIGKIRTFDRANYCTET